MKIYHRLFSFGGVLSLSRIWYNTPILNRLGHKAMIIEIEGRHKHKDVVNVYLGNLCRSLKLNRLQRVILIKFKSRLDNDAQGLCEGEESYAQISIGTKNAPFLLQMQALAHEMVHAKQFLRGELTSIGVFKWKGRNAENYAYINQPWEKEAYRMERELFLDCFPFEMYDA